VYNCRVVGNLCGNDYGGGICLYSAPGYAGGFIINCTIVSNRTGASGKGAGVYLENASCYLQNSIVYYNAPSTASNVARGGAAPVQFCCTTPTNATDEYCITNEPAFVSLTNLDLRLAVTSPCVNAGYTPCAPGPVDLDGHPRVQNGTVDIGCYETLIPPAVAYVAINGGHIFPFDSWANAATTIQDAVDAVATSGTVWVSNGVYNTEGRTVGEYLLTNRVVVTNAATLRSVNGPRVTAIEGAYDPFAGTPWGPAAIRCIYLGPGAMLEGFTLTNGATAKISGDEGFGAGAYAVGATLSNCVVVNNQGFLVGGGVYGGTVHRSEFARNFSLFGGGAADARLYHCFLHSNGAQGGAGANGCDMVNCLVVQNGAVVNGGGAQGGTLTACTIAYNQAGSGGVGAGGGGVHNSTTINCIVYFNTPDNSINSEHLFTCTEPLPPGPGNLDADPLFYAPLQTNYHLLYGSPCIDTGSNLLGVADDDLDQTPRPLDGNFDSIAAWDMGCYEYDPETADSNGDGVPDWWYHRFGLDPTNAATTHDDADGDQCDNQAEWLSDTVPTDSANYLRMTDIQCIPPNTIVTFAGGTQSVQIIEGAPSPDQGAWVPLATNTPPTASPGTFTFGAGALEYHFRIRASR
jgi:hypothetical protein